MLVCVFFKCIVRALKIVYCLYQLNTSQQLRQVQWLVAIYGLVGSHQQHELLIWRLCLASMARWELCYCWLSLSADCRLSDMCRRYPFSAGNLKLFCLLAHFIKSLNLAKFVFHLFLSCMFLNNVMCSHSILLECDAALQSTHLNLELLLVTLKCQSDVEICLLFLLEVLSYFHSRTF